MAASEDPEPEAKEQADGLQGDLDAMLSSQGEQYHSDLLPWIIFPGK